MDRLGHDAPLPSSFQGRWKGADEPSAELIVEGGEVTCYGSKVDYDYKLIGSEDGALTVSLEKTNEVDRDEFERANVTGLVISPDGDLLAYNVRFAAEFVRG